MRRVVLRMVRLQGKEGGLFGGKFSRRGSAHTLGRCVGYDEGTSNLPFQRTVSSVLSVSPPRLLLFLVLACACCLPCHAQESEDQAPTPETLAEVDRLVDQLGSDSYEERERAGQRLLELGEVAWDRVFETSQSGAD